MKGVINNKKTTLVRVHPLDLLSDVLGDQSGERSGSELSNAMQIMSKNKNGIIILIRDKFADTLSNKFLQKINKTSKNIRNYGLGAQILLDLGVKEMTILSNSKATAKGLDGFGLSIKNWKKLG